MLAPSRGMSAANPAGRRTSPAGFAAFIPRLAIRSCACANGPASYCDDLARRARAASRLLATANGGRKNRWLLLAADGLEQHSPDLLQANANDIAAAGHAGLTMAPVDRLRLTPERIRAAANGLREIAALPDPVGRVLDSSVRPNGLHVHKVAVPLGVIFFIYESRPNVTVDAAGSVRQERQRGHPARRQGSAPLQHRPARDPRRMRWRTAELPADAVQLVATADRDGRRQAVAARPLHRPGDSARRREPDPPRGRRGARCRCSSITRATATSTSIAPPTSTWRADHRQRQVPAARRLQRGREPAGPRGRRRGVPAAGGGGAAQPRRRDARLPGDLRSGARMRSRRPTRITRPSFSI